MYLLKYRQLYHLKKLSHSMASAEIYLKEPVEKVASCGTGVQSQSYAGHYHSKCDRGYLNCSTRTFQNSLSLVNIYRILLIDNFISQKIYMKILHSENTIWPNS
jgi:hypothetical protein